MDFMMISIKIRNINPHIVCSLCAGYFVDATTIIECLHTFCKSCIVKYLQSSKYCPTCNIKIHETQPLLNVKLDRTMQDVVNKIVPNICEEEERKWKEFYETRGLQLPQQVHAEEPEEWSERRIHADFSKFKSSYRDDEQISLCIDRHDLQDEFDDFDVPELPRKYLRCTVRAKVTHLRKLLNRLIDPPEEYELDIMCNDEYLPDLASMKYVYITYWKQKGQPMFIHYKYRRIVPDQQFIEDISDEESIITNNSDYISSQDQLMEPSRIETIEHKYEYEIVQQHMTIDSYDDQPKKSDVELTIDSYDDQPKKSDVELTVENVHVLDYAPLRHQEQSTALVVGANIDIE